MKKISASLLEVVHLAAVSILFTLTVWIASFPGPLRSWSGSGFNAAGGPGATGEITSFLDLRGPWIAGIGLVAVAVAGFLRGDGKKVLPLLRLIATSATMLFALWVSMGLPAQRLPQAWNCLFFAAAADLLLTGFLVVPGKGGGKAKPSGDK